MAPSSKIMGWPIRATAELNEARSLFAMGLLDEARIAAEQAPRRSGSDAEEAAILLARIDLRKGDAASVVSRLESVFGKPAAGSLAAMLLGIALFRIDDSEPGLAFIESAYRDAQTTEIRAEAAYYRAWAAYADRDLDTADRWAMRSLDDALGIVYARALALCGWICEARTDYAGAARTFRLALNAMRSATERDDELVARILHALAVFGAELFDRSLADFVGNQLHTFKWPASASLHQFQTALHLAIAEESDGEVEDALDGFDCSALIAPERNALAAQAALETADLYQILGEPTAARRAMRSAAERLRVVDWPTAEISEQMALLECVCIAARLEPSTAVEWCNRYSAFPKHDAGWSALASDQRVRILERHALALLDCAVGNTGPGIESLQDAANAWESLGYVRRAAYAVADLVNQGATDATERLATLLRRAPGHPLRRMLSPAHADDEPRSAEKFEVDLSPAERRVLDALLAGTSVREMAAAWNRSEFTIRNHLKRLFAKFGVRSSAALVAKALTQPGTVTRHDASDTLVSYRRSP